MNGARPVVLKIGGAVGAADDAALDLVAERRRAGEAVVIVHGGGPLVGEWSRRLGLETRFENGLRVTDEPTRDVALAVLAGLVNKQLVAALAARGANAIGVSGADGGLLVAKRARDSLGLVGEVLGARGVVLWDLVASGAIPVVAPAAIDERGELVNVNADSAAGAIAADLGARLLVFLTDVDGVRGPRGELVARLDARAVERLRAEGTVTGGMLPKLEAGLRAARAGCLTAIVHGGDRAGLRTLLEGGRAGSVIEPEAVDAER